MSVWEAGLARSQRAMVAASRSRLQARQAQGARALSGQGQLVGAGVLLRMSGTRRGVCLLFVLNFAIILANCVSNQHRRGSSFHPDDGHGSSECSFVQQLVTVQVEQRRQLKRTRWHLVPAHDAHA